MANGAGAKTGAKRAPLSRVQAMTRWNELAVAGDREPRNPNTMSLSCALLPDRELDEALDNARAGGGTSRLFRVLGLDLSQQEG